MLADRKRVEELVRDEEQRARRKLIDAFVPLRAGQRLLLKLPQHRAGLDEMDFARKSSRPEDPQRVARERAPARPKLGVDGVRGRTGALPAVREAGADHLAEHLADLRRGGEVTARAQGITGGVIIAVARFHIGFDGDRAFRGYPVAERSLERSHETAAVPAVDSTRTRRPFAVHISHSPPRIIGSDSHWPM